jgi:trehalose 6-phosphate synthase/phosphatase
MADLPASRVMPRPARLGNVGRIASEPVKTQIYFRYAFEKSQFGDTVRVVGSHPAMGSWDPNRGVNLTTDSDLFPCWKSTAPVEVGLHADIEYKYVIIGPDGNVRSWEEYPGNRRFVASGPEMVLEDDEGLYRQKRPSECEDSSAEDDAVDQVGSLLRAKPLVGKLDKDQKLAYIRELEGDATIDVHDIVYMVCCTLPVTVTRGPGNTWEVQPSNEADKAFPVIKKLKQKKKRVVCVGWPGVHVTQEEKRKQLERTLLDHDCIPVFAPQLLYDKYLKFCTSFLWPIFHDVMLFFQTANPQPFDEEGWGAYTYMNDLFANTVAPHLHEADSVWVWDYHLIMVPTFISRRAPTANIGFYLHVPFPSSDSFKALPVREELMSGMLNADQLGFQFFAYARNFITSAKRMLGLDPTYRPGAFIGLDYNGREIMIKVAHFVYPFKDALAIVKEEPVPSHATEIGKLFEGKTIFACMDRCDGLSGLIPKFRAFRRFLSKNGHRRGQVVLVQYLYESQGYEEATSLKDYLSGEADAIISANDDGVLEWKPATNFPRSDGDTPDIFIRFIPLQARTERLALFRAAHVLLDATVKAGLNLMPFEFITAHHDDTGGGHAAHARHGVSILSEFSGCSRVLLGSLRVNPWNTNELVDACEKALSMTDEERKERFDANLQYADEYSTGEWFEDFLTDLRRARKHEGLQLQTIGFGSRTRIVALGQMEKLGMDEVLRGYTQSKKRMIFLDNEGTLAADTRHLFREYGAPKGEIEDLKSHGTGPNATVLENLKILAEDPRNTVVILSGRGKEKLEEWFGSVPKSGLAAEHGFYIKLPVITNEAWRCVGQGTDDLWMIYAFQLMKQFVKRTQGSFIENKGSALVWQYRDADQHFGSWQAKELSSHLKELLFGFDVEVIDGKGYVEVKLKNINKGVAVEKVLTRVAKLNGDADFVLCIGDDRSDEDMFEAINRFVDPSDGNADEAADSGDTISQQSTAEGSDDHFDHERHASRKRASGGVDSKKASLDGATGAFKGLGGRVTSRANMGGMGLFGGPASGGRAGGSIAGDLAGMCGTGTDEEDNPRRCFTVTVGQKPSAAKFCLHDVEEVSDLLASLASSNKRKTRKETSLANNSYTWTAGASRTASMPGLSNLNFGSSGTES